MAKVTTPSLGITLPIQLGNSGYFQQGRDILTQVKSNLTNLILTRKGERPMQPDFGCDVHRIIFEPITNDNVAEIKATIGLSTKIWMPYLIIENVNVVRSEDTNTVFATITFTINSNVKITDSITLSF